MNRAEALFREAVPRLDDLREKAPLVHCMTGAVSVNFCANAVLALGARPICAEHPAESAEIAVQAAALSLSLANITEARDSAMRLAAGAARAADAWLQMHPRFRCRVEASLAIMTAIK